MDHQGTDESTTVKDSDRSTQGGPPGWIAFVIVAVLFLIVALLAAFTA